MSIPIINNKPDNNDEALIKKQTDKIKSELIAWLNIWIGVISLILVLLSQVGINLTVKEKFTEPNVQSTLEKVAIQEATNLIEKKLDPAIEEAKSTISEKTKTLEIDLAKVSGLTSDAFSKIQEIEQISDFSRLVLSAQNDNRISFNELIKLTSNPNHPFAIEAYQTVHEIRLKFRSPPGYIVIDWRKLNYDPNNLTFEDFQKLYSEITLANQPALIEYLKTRSDFSRYKKLNFLFGILSNSNSLNTTYYAGKIFAEEANIDWNPFVLDNIVKWWERNKDIIK
ncbi:MAG: hypothetical protein AB7S78_01495 [Candidatus Omnitrophota bacterium]